MPQQGNKLAVITGAAHRLGATTARVLHNAGYDIIIHYRSSNSAAEDLAHELNTIREQSATTLPASLGNISELSQLAKTIEESYEGVDLLVNNASSFYPTSADDATEEQWNDLFDANVKGSFFLSQALKPSLVKKQGNIVNIIDIYAERPLKDYPIYSMAKAALAMMTKSLAVEFAPDIRVNGVSPGAILWPEHESDNTELQQKILNKVPLSRTGDPVDISNAVLFLAQSPYITGQILAVDGGRSINM